MRAKEEIDQVLGAIEDEDPDADFEDLQAMHDVLAWIAGHDTSSADDFINHHIKDS